jgi:hypothetical protein
VRNRYEKAAPKHTTSFIIIRKNPASGMSATQLPKQGHIGQIDSAKQNLYREEIQTTKGHGGKAAEPRFGGK